MREIADDVLQLWGFPPNGVNTYLVGDVLVDAGTPLDGWSILRQLRDRSVGALALTHAHPDHQGSSHRVCESLGIPYWVGEHDADVAENPTLFFERIGFPNQLGILGLPLTPVPIAKLASAAISGPGHPVDRALTEGDEVAGFEVLHVPGHTAGHVALWRESDRVLIAGDVVWNFAGLMQPFAAVNTDHDLSRESVKRIAALEPSVVCFGHGPPLTDTGKLVKFAEAL